ncbi:hypothetical protein JRQ81_013412 [Phrynocephalus forsythii]|uniref:Uncharacterized protein n=1 Tax=Phrynocephalus forsythii TaxID=171643 RepID=A0A9Q0Y128_9SAUR|nr:hypothetical protein JRQ81_013412 [Phrynocephalus forsythii]
MHLGSYRGSMATSLKLMAWISPNAAFHGLRDHPGRTGEMASNKTCWGSASAWKESGNDKRKVAGKQRTDILDEVASHRNVLSSFCAPQQFFFLELSLQQLQEEQALAGEITSHRTLQVKC